MDKEPIIEDKIHLLMEETGCDQGEAQLALASAGYDLEKAVRTIHGLLKNIVVIKGRLHVPARNFYGLLLAIVDTRRESLHRLRAVVSYNPALFETSLSGDWYAFEKDIYAFRLGEGTLQQISQDLERLLSERWGESERVRFMDWVRHGDARRVMESGQRLVSAAFSGDAVVLDLVRDVIDLDQFRRLGPKEPVPQPVSAPGSGENLLLDIDLERDPAGTPAAQVVAGDTVRALLTDERDVAQYLSKLLGGRGPEGFKSLPSPVESVLQDGGSIRFQIRLSGAVLGLAVIPADVRLKIERRAGGRWWSRLPFLGG